MTPEYTLRNDIETIAVDEGVRLEVYWKKLKIGKGPAVSLFILEEEILRIDCFGKDAAHMHVAFFLPAAGENRLWMPEATVEEQIERAGFELYRNYRYYQSRIPNPKIRSLKIDPEKMKDASEKAVRLMKSFTGSVTQPTQEPVDAT